MPPRCHEESDAMTPHEFVDHVRKSIVEENILMYQDIFASTAIADATDPHWIRTLTLYATLDGEGKKVLLDIMRQVVVDTISSVFSILDGNCYLENFTGDFALLTDPPTEVLNGELQDRFLKLEEDSKGDAR